MMMIIPNLRGELADRRPFVMALSIAAMHICFACNGVSAEPLTPVLTEHRTHSLNSLIDMLDSPSRAVRHRAMEDLLGRGAQALPMLRKTEGRSPAVVVVCEELIRRIEAQIEEKTFQGQPIVLSNVKTAAQFVQQVEKQTGNKVAWEASVPFYREKLPSSAMSFWSFMDHVANSHHIGWEHSAQRSFVLTDETTPPIKVSDSTGGVRVAVQFHPQQRSFNPKAKKLARSEMTVELEPRFLPYFLSCADATLTLNSVDGTYEPFTPTAKREVLFRDRNRVQWRTDFLRIKDSQSNDGCSLSGRFNLVYASKLVPLNVSLTDNRKGQSVVEGETELTLIDFGRDADGDFFIDATIKPGWNLEYFSSHRIGLLHREVKLMTLSRTVQAKNVELRSVANGVHTLRWVFNAPWKKNTDAKFVYIAPVAIHTREIDFHISNFDFE